MGLAHLLGRLDRLIDFCFGGLTLFFLLSLLDFFLLLRAFLLFELLADQLELGNAYNRNCNKGYGIKGYGIKGNGIKGNGNKGNGNEGNGNESDGSIGNGSKGNGDNGI